MYTGWTEKKLDGSLKFATSVYDDIEGHLIVVHRIINILSRQSAVRKKWRSVNSK